MNELALFAGAGGGLLASKWLLGHRIVCYVEKDPYCIKVLEARIGDGLLDDAPIWDDVRTFDGRPWCGIVDCISAGFPCQPFADGGNRRGEQDERNAWPDTIRIIRDVQPAWVFLENSPRLLAPFRTKKLPAYIGSILADLAESGYVGRWGCLSAASFGAAHKRERIWIAAHTSSAGRPFFLRSGQESGIESNQGDQERRIRSADSLDALFSLVSQLENRLGEPSVCGVDDGLAYRVDRLATAGQGQVPAVARAAWNLLTQGGN